MALIWLSVYQEDYVILLPGLVIFIVWILRISGFWIMGELVLILIVPILFGAVVGGVIGSMFRRKKNILQKSNVEPTIRGTIIGTLLGFIAGAFLWVIAVSMINP